MNKTQRIKIAHAYKKLDEWQRLLVKDPTVEVRADEVARILANVLTIHNDLDAKITDIQNVLKGDEL